MKNQYDRIYNILIEAASFGGSPSRTGHRVGAAMAALKTKLGGGSAEYRRKQVQTRRIQRKTAHRQEDYHARHSGATSSDDREQVYSSAASRFAQNYEAGKKKNQGVDSRGKKVTAGDPGKGASRNL